MKIHKILSFVMLMAVSATLFTSCAKDDDDVFDKSSSDRSQEAMAAAKAVLRGASNGWVMDYYYGEDASNGGVPYVIKFDSLTCTATSDEDSLMTDESYYTMTNDNGPVLSFNTANKVIQKHAIPSSGNYEGDKGDFEFVVMSATPELVVLKGKRIGNYCYLHPLADGETAKSYLEKVQTMSDSLYIGYAKGQVGGAEVNFNIDVDNKQLKALNADGAALDSCAFTVTDKGMRLDKTLDINGKQLSEFAYDPKNVQLTGLNSGATDVVLDCSRPATWRPYSFFAGKYVLTYTPTIDDEGNKTTRTMNVTLEPTGDGQTYNIKGIALGYDIVCTYKKSTGGLEINSYKLGDSGVYEVKLCILDYSGSTLSWQPKVGLSITWDGKDASNPNLKVDTNSYLDFVSGGLILWIFRDNSAVSNSSASGSKVSTYFQSTAGQKWLFTNGSYVIDDLKSLKKVN